MHAEVAFFLPHCSESQGCLGGKPDMGRNRTNTSPIRAMPPLGEMELGEMEDLESRSGNTSQSLGAVQ